LNPSDEKAQEGGKTGGHEFFRKVESFAHEGQQGQRENQARMMGIEPSGSGQAAEKAGQEAADGTGNEGGLAFGFQEADEPADEKKGAVDKEGKDGERMHGRIQPGGKADGDKKRWASAGPVLIFCPYA
jgi:hypothetical protein